MLACAASFLVKVRYMSETQIQLEGQPLPLSVYPFRNSLYEELHNRPSPKVASPCFVSHLAMIRGEEAAKEEYQLVLALCQRFSVNPPPADASCFYQNFVHNLR